MSITRCLIVLFVALGNAHAITLDSCQTLARKNYPLIRQHDLLEKVKTYSLENASKGFLPQVNISGQASYQSDVTALPIKIPGMSIPQLSKDQYRLYGEINQPLTDLKTVHDQREVARTSADAEIQRTEVELYKIRERISSIYFGIVLLEAQRKQNQLYIDDLQASLQRMRGAIEAGTALPSAADQIEAEQLKARQRMTELESAANAYKDMLSQFTLLPLTAFANLEVPVISTAAERNDRPELTLIDFQQRMLDAQTKVLSDRNLPKFSLFLQAGLGRPALNMLNNDIASYYIGGLRLNWNLSSFYTSGKERDVILTNRSILSVQKELFLFNNALTIRQQDAEIVKLRTLMEQDESIIRLRNNIRKTSESQLASGTTTMTDYLMTVHNEEQARQQLIIHRIQLMQALNNKELTLGTK